MIKNKYYWDMDSDNLYKYKSRLYWMKLNLKYFLSIDLPIALLGLLIIWLIKL